MLGMFRSSLSCCSLFLGRNALHLAAKYGHALCLQKLLQVLKIQIVSYSSPTEGEKMALHALGQKWDM